ncbi:MAG: putative peroxiredoxin, partial [Deltaproteobacteria bacterium]|nr:putative peroxiredoxin [Deltaproteobacteria bacterium]
MKHLARLVAVVAALLFVAPGVDALEVGQQAPEFSLAGSDGKTYRLADFAGKRGFVLAWFPKAFTSGCTAELEDLRDAAAAIAAYDAAVFMVSLDPPEKNAEFAKSVDAKQVLLSDADGSVARAFGVSGLGSYAKRWTFYV